MDDDLPSCYLEYESRYGYDYLLVDDASGHDSGIHNCISDELDIDQVRNKRAACNVTIRCGIMPVGQDLFEYSIPSMFYGHLTHHSQRSGTPPKARNKYRMQYLTCISLHPFLRFSELYFLFIYLN